MNYMLRKEGDRRLFNDANIQAAIDDALKSVDEDDPVAVVAHFTPHGARLSAIARLGDGWTIMAAAYAMARAEHAEGLKWGAEARVIWTPKLGKR